VDQFVALYNAITLTARRQQIYWQLCDHHRMGWRAPDASSRISQMKSTYLQYPAG